MFLSKKMMDIDERSREVLADIVILMQNKDVCEDREFIQLLNNAIDLAEKDLLSSKAREMNINKKPKEIANP